VPRLDQARKMRLEVIEGVPPDLIHMPKGCPFYPRCTYRTERCAEEMPPLVPVADKHNAACWEWQRVSGPRHVAEVPQ
jgi:oligopeptide transport system ATP-binding protein